MNKKKIIISAAVISIIGLFVFNLAIKPQSQKDSNNIQSIKKETVADGDVKDTLNQGNIKRNNKTIKSGITEYNNVSNENESIINTNLCNDIPSNALPLSVITELSELPKNVQDTVLNISSTNNIYMIHKDRNKLLLITDSPDNIRHGIDFTEITISNGHQIKTTLGYSDKMDDSKNDIWAYNPETNQPMSHTKYNADGDVEFVETWNYDSNNPVKYEMKNSNGKVVSMRKETLNNGTDLRIEHLVYDTNGNTKINVSTTYDGEDLKRFTYYNADKVNESGSIFSDYTDGQKTKEVVYTSDLKVKNTYTSDYKEGNRENITIYDNNNNELKKYTQKVD